MCLLDLVLDGHWDELQGSGEVYGDICPSSKTDTNFSRPWTGPQHLTLIFHRHHFLLLTALDFSTSSSLSNWILSVLL